MRQISKQRLCQYCTKLCHWEKPKHKHWLQEGGSRFAEVWVLAILLEEAEAGAETVRRDCIRGEAAVCHCYVEGIWGPGV